MKDKLKSLVELHGYKWLDKHELAIDVLPDEHLFIKSTNNNTDYKLGSAHLVVVVGIRFSFRVQGEVTFLFSK